MVSLPDMIDAKYKTSICVPKDIADKYPELAPREVGKRMWAEALERERSTDPFLEYIYSLGWRGTNTAKAKAFVLALLQKPKLKAGIVEKLDEHMAGISHKE